jgi:spore germination protein YaaH
MPFGNAHAESNDLEYAGWIPYWADKAGADDARDHIRDLDTVYPFAYEVAYNGTLLEKVNLHDRHWDKLIESANDHYVEVIPTVMWNDGAAIDAVLQNKDARAYHIDAIVDMVDRNDFDGVNIDYESKLAKTKDAFSTFLKELSHELDGKTLTCTVEARTPPTSLYREVPATLEYANDYDAIAKYCDRVEIMAYDQQRADILLNDEKSGEPYIPVADPDWVEKVITLAMKDIPAEKIVLGVPTYGRDWTVTVAPNWFQSYTSNTSLNPGDAEDIADEYDVEPGRNKAGERSFTYFPEDSIFKVLNALPTPKGTATGNEAAAKALLFANATGMSVPVNVTWYSDAAAIKDKVDLAKHYGLAGVALFKIDGEEDDDLWDLLD